MNLVFRTRTLFYVILVGIILVITTMILTLKVIPEFVTKMIWEAKVLKKGTEQWEMFMEVPFPFDFKVYLFEVANPDEILQGAKPKIQERGPYVYKLFRWKTDVKWNADDDISYYEYTRYEFDDLASGKRAEDDVVTVINTAYNGLLLTAESMSPDALPTISETLETVFGEHNGIFMKVKVKELLFDGIPICKDGGVSGGFASKMVCGQMISKARESKPMWVVNNTIMMANFHYKNYTHLGKFTVKSGLINKEDSGKLIKYNDEPYMSAWLGGHSKCNKIRGITNIFPPNLSPDMTFEVFGEDVCRMMTVDYKRTETVKGVLGYRFGAKNTTFNAVGPDSEDYCFCVNKSRTLEGDFGCQSDGICDLSTCLGAPVLMSFPHLLFADKKYLESVEGVNPNSEEHETFLTLEPISGIPMKMAKRIQMNMFIRPIDEIIEIENISHALMPIMWVEESLTLGDKYMDKIKKDLLGTLHIVDIVKWVFIAIGGLAIAIPFFLIVYNQ